MFVWFGGGALHHNVKGCRPYLVEQTGLGYVDDTELCSKGMRSATLCKLRLSPPPDARPRKFPAGRFHRLV